MKKLILLVLINLIFKGVSLAAPPSWFPKVSCKKDWSKLIPKNLHKYTKEEGYQNYIKRINRSSCYKDWTVLVYMAADNDLTPYAYWDLYEMEAGFKSGNYAASTLKSDLLVQVDTEGDKGIRRLHMFQSDENYNSKASRSYIMNRGFSKIYSPVVGKMTESTRARRTDQYVKFYNFLEWGMKKYPARNYMVVVWGHGQGYGVVKKQTHIVSNSRIDDFGIPTMPATLGRPPIGGQEFPWQRGFGGVAFDNTSKTFLGVPLIRRVLNRVKTQFLHKNIDVYASDACLMQMAEVATEISRDVNYIVGSAQIQDFLGLPYRRIMYMINTGSFNGLKKQLRTNDEPFLVSKMIPQLMKSSLYRGNSLQGRFTPEAHKDVTSSSISTRELIYNLLPSLKVFSGRMINYIKENPIRALDVQALIQSNSQFLGSGQDLASFLSFLEMTIKEEAEMEQRWTPAARDLLESIKRVHNYLSQTVVQYNYGTRYQSFDSQLNYLRFKAFAVWLPISKEDFQKRIPDFRRSLFYKYFQVSNSGKNLWLEWLKAVYFTKFE